MEPQPSHHHPNPIDIIAQEHMSLMGVCDDLETIADDIPLNIDRLMVRQTAQNLRLSLMRLQKWEEENLFPLVKKRAKAEDDIDSILAEFSNEHALDAGYAQEVFSVLEPLAQGEPLPNNEMAGYLLRGFFENVRRHLRWEEAIILKIARQRLSQTDLVEMYSEMEQDIYSPENLDNSS